MNENSKKIVLFLTVLLGAVGTVGVSTPSVAQTGASALPEPVKDAAIATRSDRTGRIAGARIGNSDHYIVYMQTPNGCGSDGCRAQIWAMQNGRPIRKESIEVGHLPIVLLPQTDNGMPRLGITVSDNGRQAILPIIYDGQNYSNSLWNALVAADTAQPIIDETMLQTF